MSQYIAYARRSTSTAQQSKWSLSTQHEDINRFVELHGGEVIGRYSEAHTGTDPNRPKLQAAIEECGKTGAVLIVSKLSRLSRDIGQVDELYRSNLRFVVVEFGIECSYEQILMFGMVNALMVQNLRKSVKRGIATSRAAGTKWNCLTEEQRRMGTEASSKKAAAQRREIGPMLGALKEQGFSYARIADTLNSMGSKSPQGNRWSKQNIYHTLKRWRQDNEDCKV